MVYQDDGAPVAHRIAGAGMDQFAGRTDGNGARTPLTDALDPGGQSAFVTFGVACAGDGRTRRRTCDSVVTRA